MKGGDYMRRKKHMHWYHFCKTYEEALKMCEDWKKTTTPYLKRAYPPYVTPWTASDTGEKFYLAWLAR